MTGITLVFSGDEQITLQEVDFGLVLVGARRDVNGVVKMDTRRLNVTPSTGSVSRVEKLDISGILVQMEMLEDLETAVMSTEAIEANILGTAALVPNHNHVILVVVTVRKTFLTLKMSLR